MVPPDRPVWGWFTRGRVIVAVAVTVAAVAVGGTAFGLATSAPSSHAVSLPRDGRVSAALKVADGTQILQVSVGNLGATLLRVSTPDNAPARPVLSGSGVIVLSLAGAAPAACRPRSRWAAARPSCRSTAST